MKSRIPQAKPASSLDQLQPRTPSRPQVHTMLLALGAPPISLEEFTRLYKGPFADVLLFMSEHVRGRKQVAHDRHLIQQMRTSPKAHIRPPDDVTRSPVERSMVLLGAAQRAVEVYGGQLGERQMALAQTQSEITELKATLANKRQVALLLRVLEERERVRVRRFQEMTRIMDSLRKSAVVTPSRKAQAQDEPSLDLPAPLQPLPRILLTQETLTNLHAYRIRLARITQADQEPSSLVTSRLRSRLAKRTRSDQEAEQLLQKYCEVARERAEQVIRYRDPRLKALPNVSRKELEGKLVVNKAKKQELQKLSDNAVALGFLCEHLISSISVFLEQTSHILRLSIEEDTPLTKGYIDVLRLRVSAQVERKVKAESFIEEVQRACKIRVPNETAAVLREVERVLHRSYQRSSFLKSLDSLQALAPCQIAEDEALITSYETGFEHVENRARKLLTRKVEKAGLGNSLVGDIEALSGDVRRMSM